MIRVFIVSRRMKVMRLIFLSILALMAQACTFDEDDVSKVTLHGSGFETSLSSYKDKLMLVSFGYTHCPDICPTTLMHVSQAIGLLKPSELKKLQPIFITLDPERDTAEKLAQYVKYFDDSLIGLAVEPSSKSMFLKHFQVESFRLSKEENYSISHTSYLYLVDEHANIIDMMGHQTEASSIAEAIRSKLKEK